MRLLGRLALPLLLAGWAGCTPGYLTTTNPVAVSATGSSFSVSKTQAIANDTDAVTLTATVVNADGGPIAGVRLLFAASGSYNNINFDGATTDANGVATSILTSSRAETKTITAVVSMGAAHMALPGSLQVTFAAGAASQLVFATQPANAQAGNLLAPAVQVNAQDAWGNLATTYDGNVTVALNGGALEVALLGNATVQAVSGVAMFDRLTVGKAGAAYMLVATASGLVTATSNTFSVSAGAATSLAFATQPGNGTAGDMFVPSVAVVLVDAYGNVVNNGNTQVTLALNANGISGVLAGTLTESVAAGIATFPDIHVDTAGSAYTLRASTSTLGPVDSNVFTVTPGPMSVATSTLSVNPNVVRLGVATNVSAMMRDAFGNRLARETVTFASTAMASRFSANSVVIDANGLAHAIYVSEQVGVQTIRATVGLVSLAADVNVLTPVCTGPLLLPGRPSLVTGNGTSDVAVGDFTGDGLADVAAADGDGLLVYAGDGNGVFAAPTVTPWGNGLSAMVAGYFDGDTHLDVMAGDGNGITFFPGNGNGTFGTTVSATSAVTWPMQVFATDLNHDHLTDVIARDPNGTQLAVYVNTGTGWNTGVLYAWSAGIEAQAITVADFTGDGNADVLVASRTGGANGAGALLMMAGNGDGTLQAASDVYDFNTTNGGPVYALDANLNGDAFSDVVTINNTSVVAVFLGQGNATFATPAFYPMLNFGAGTLGDINNDGFLDLVAGAGGTAWQIMLGQGNALFQPVGVFYGGSSRYPPQLGDVNRDGFLDVVAANASSDAVNVVFGHGDGTFANPLVVGVAGGVSNVAVGDVTGDGAMDVLAQGPNALTSYINDGNGHLAATAFTRAGAYVAAQLGDFNGDGKLDYTALSQGNAIIALGDGNGLFGAEASYPCSVGLLRYLDVVDLNGDGNQDVLAVGGPLCVLMGQGHGTLAAPLIYTTPAGPWALASGDLNGDSHPDVVVASLDGNGNATVAVFVNGGDANGVLAAPVNYNFLGSLPMAMALGDFDQMNGLDVALVIDTVMTPLLNQGNGTLVAGTPALVYAPRALAAADITGDGVLDLLGGYDGVGLAVGRGDGTFGAAIPYLSGLEFSNAAHAAVDMNGDGRIDVVSADLAAGNILVLLNQGCH